MASVKTRIGFNSCRSASLQTPSLCGHNKAGGLKAPGYLFSRLSDVFLRFELNEPAHRSSLTAHRSSLTAHRSLLKIINKGGKAFKGFLAGFLNFDGKLDGGFDGTAQVCQLL